MMVFENGLDGTLKKIGLLAILVIFIASSFHTVASLVPPPVIGGIITADDIPLEGVAIRLDNHNNGEYCEQITAYDDPPHSKGGGYAVCLQADEGDIIYITVFYEGKEYYGSFTLYSGSDINWFNFSISTEGSTEPPPSNPPSTPPDDPPEEEDPEDDQEEDTPDEQNESGTGLQYYNLTVSILDNETKKPIKNASVSVFDLEIRLIAKNNTNESGNVTFNLEEGEYIVEAEKGNYRATSDRITLSSSSAYCLSLDEDKEQNSASFYMPNENADNHFFLYLIIGLGAVATIVIFSIILSTKKR